MHTHTPPPKLQQTLVVSREYLYYDICFCISILDYFTEENYRNLTLYAIENVQFMELSPTPR